MRSPRSKNVVYEKTYYEKKKLKRTQSKVFNKKCKEQHATAKAKWRLKKKQQQPTAQTPVSQTPTTPITSMCKQEGLKRRRANTLKLKTEIEKLRATVQLLTNKNKKLKVPLTVLHQQFELETNIDIDYDTFCRHVPEHIVKPSHDGWGTCLCISCLNPQMKYEKLYHLKQKNQVVRTHLDGYPCDLSEIVKDEQKTNEFKENLMKLDKENFNVIYCEWQKKKLPNCVALVSTKVTETQTIHNFLKKFIAEIGILANHVHKIREQYRAAKQAKEEAKGNDSVATIQLDWSENYHLQQTREEKGAFYYEQHIALQTGHVWLKDGTFSFGSISDDINHMAEAAWAGIQSLLKHLVEDLEITSINIISDSPISQYRNKTMFYLMKTFAISRKIKMKWIFLESGHGKGVADAFGASLKRMFDETVNFKPDESFSNASDLVNAIKDQTAIKLYLYDKSDIENVKKSLPKLETVKGTASLHEITVSSDHGTMYGKDVSSDKDKLLKVKF
ncbi:unnamed protein product [Didymodactylos carnosus]|uniref:Uncharacterized protein n=1 Tax=Didymodactylos carnosus TaxID=1234261 RepID=A0A816B417_9BILA|nr:unnamed protein product [Didymodactylos carnosus]CAF4484672.1 unnamed protein product [Didymodactylos carnosus]